MIAALTVAVVKLLAAPNVRWTGCHPDERQRIYFANHTSHLDAVVLWAALPAQLRRCTRPVAARDYWAKSKFRLFMAGKVFHAALIERERVTKQDNPLASLLQALAAGASLIIFPEGTRGTGLEIHPFKSGLYHLARKRPDVELVPVYIDNLNRVLPKGEVLPVPLLSCITLGSPVQLRENEAKLEFLERARAAVLNLRQK